MSGIIKLPEPGPAKKKLGLLDFKGSRIPEGRDGHREDMPSEAHKIALLH